jgi:hypothetical protein
MRVRHERRERPWLSAFSHDEGAKAHFNFVERADRENADRWVHRAAQ